MLKRGGRCASVVPDTVLTGDNEAYKTIRQALVDQHCLQGVISMPSGVFQPYSGVSTAIIIFTKTGTGGTDKVWFYDMHNDGYSLTTQRNPIDDNDIPDILQRFEHLDKESERSRKDQSFLVSVDEIRENGFDLSYKKYHDNQVLQKIYHLETLQESDIRELEHIFWQELGSQEEYQEQAINIPFGTNIAAFLRTIIGINQDEALQKYRELVNNAELTRMQEDYLRTIIRYVCQNGDIRKEILVNQQPFNSINVAGLFGDKATTLVTYVDMIHNAIG